MEEKGDGGEGKQAFWIFTANFYNLNKSQMGLCGFYVQVYTFSF